MRLLCLSFLFLPFAASAQDGCAYFTHKFRAEAYMHKDRPDSSLIEYRRAFAIHTHGLADLLIASHIALQHDSLDAAACFLRAAASCGLAWQDLPIQIKSAAIAAGITDSDRWLTQFRPLPPGADVELIARVRRMAERDQMVRSEEVTVEDAVMWAADSLNALDLRAIVQEMGRLPGYSDLGWEGLDDLDLLFHHMQFKDLQFFMPYVIASIRLGEYLDNTTIAYQMDRIAVSEGRALYIDEKDLLQALPAGQTPLAGRVYWSATGEWDDFLPNGESVIWPVWPGLGEAGANKTRQRLCLDSVSDGARRKPWLRQASAKEIRTAFGIKD
ncbi:MAG TPA: hypothetical protein PKL15_17070 [Saprospiraceae bacterium]|nr:hypothetical protein [Saprospiraceae bacterium]